MPEFTEPYYEIIDFAANEKPNEFVNKFNELMYRKAYDAVEKYKQEIANSFFDSNDQETEEEETSDENS